MNKKDFAVQRQEMIEHHLLARGIRAPAVLQAMSQVPREAFLPSDLQEFAYEDAPLPIEEGQTISQPYIVALMVESLLLRGGETVLEIGTGSGYAAAVLAQVAGKVYTLERVKHLAQKASATLRELGYTNVQVVEGDGTLGWPAQAPYDGIVVTAGGPGVPASLKAQLKPGGRLVIPIGFVPRVQELVRITRISDSDYKSEELADVRFVPLIGKEGWAGGEAAENMTSRPSQPSNAVSATIARSAESFDSADTEALDALLARIGDARVVLLGEATHGTSEFYRMREQISRQLIQKKGFSFIAIEGDWPDAARIDHYVRHAQYPASEWIAFARFPTWMWRNQEVRRFVEWLRRYNAILDSGKRIAFYGLDLYSLYTSIRSVLEYLDHVDPKTAQVARVRYGCMTPWQTNPAIYGQAALSATFQTCEREVVAMLGELLAKYRTYSEHDGERFMDAVQNARLVANAEHYYRTMYYGSRSSWNLRDTHMFETLRNLLEFHGPQSRAIVWAHNSHVGDSSATEMALRGEYNIGHLCRETFGADAYRVGFGTHSGTVAAASQWDAPMEIKTVRPSVEGSYERACHNVGLARFMLPLRHASATVVEALTEPQLERAIGVLYLPETELQSHYFHAVLPRQFDEYIWFDETLAITPLATEEMQGLPDTYPFGL